MGATASIVTTIAGTAGTAYGQVQNANAITDRARFESSLADLQSKDAIARGDFEAGQREQAGRRTIASERAGFAAGGIDASSGSAADVQASEAGISELDAQMIRNNAAREAWGYKAQAQLNSVAASNEADAERRQAFSTVLTGASNTYGLIRQSRGVGRSPNGLPAPPNGGFNVFRK